MLHQLLLLLELLLLLLELLQLLLLYLRNIEVGEAGGINDGKGRVSSTLSGFVDAAVADAAYCTTTRDFATNDGSSNTDAANSTYGIATAR